MLDGLLTTGSGGGLVRGSPHLGGVGPQEVLQRGGMLNLCIVPGCSPARQHAPLANAGCTLPVAGQVPGSARRGTCTQVPLAADGVEVTWYWRGRGGRSMRERPRRELRGARAVAIQRLCGGRPPLDC